MSDASEPRHSELTGGDSLPAQAKSASGHEEPHKPHAPPPAASASDSSGRTPVPTQAAPQEAAPSEISSEQASLEAKEYGRAELRCTIADLLLDHAVLLVIAFALAVPLDRWLQTYAYFESRWVRLVAFFLLTTGLHYLVSFPLSFYSGFVLEHRFGLSRQSLGRWLKRYLLQNTLITLFSTLLVSGLFAMIWIVGGTWWLWAAGASFVVSVVLGQLVPVLILPLFYQIERLEDEALLQRLKRLTEGTSLSLEGIYRIVLSRETAKANAMLAGMGRTRRVILGDTLLDQFTPEEIEVVFAHEVGHHVFHHIRKLIGLGLVYSVGSFWLCDLALRTWATDSNQPFDYHQVPVYALALMMLVITVFSTLLSPLRNSLSRHFEHQCDEYALEQTLAPTAYYRAFQKLARINKADLDPHPWEVVWFHDHPPISERLARAERFAARTGQPLEPLDAQTLAACSVPTADSQPASDSPRTLESDLDRTESRTE